MRALLFAFLAVGVASAALSSELEAGCAEMRCVADPRSEGEIPKGNGKSPNDPVLRLKRDDYSNKICKLGEHTTSGAVCYCTDNGTAWICAGTARQSDIFVLAIVGSVFLALLSAIYHR